MIRLGLAMMKVLKLNNEVKIMLVKGDGGGMIPGMYYVSVAQWPEQRVWALLSGILLGDGMTDPQINSL